jgi:hypothetical protein
MFARLRYGQAGARHPKNHSDIYPDNLDAGGSQQGLSRMAITLLLRPDEA